MSKLRRNKNSTLSMPPQQAKISSFFQATSFPNAVAASSLFTCVGSSGDQRSIPNSDNSSSDVTKRVATSHVAKSDISQAVEKSYCSYEISKNSTCVTPETDCSNDSPHAKQIGDNEGLDDSELIPDTPQSSNSIVDRRKFQRSFLSTSTNLLTDKVDVVKKKATLGSSSKMRSLEHRLKQRKAASDFNINGNHSICNIENRICIIVDDDDVENSPSLPALSSADGKRMREGSLPEAKRTDNKLTPVKCEESRAVYSERNVGQRLFDRGATNSKGSMTTFQIIQSCRTTKNTVNEVTKDRGLDLENDDHLLGVLNELKVDSQKAEVDVEFSTIFHASEVVCKASAVKTSIGYGSENKGPKTGSDQTDTFSNEVTLPSVVCSGSPEQSTDFKHWHDSELDSLLLELRQDVGHLDLQKETLIFEEASVAKELQPSDVTGFKIESQMDVVPEKCIAKQESDLPGLASFSALDSVLAIPGSTKDGGSSLYFGVEQQDCEKLSSQDSSHAEFKVLPFFHHFGRHRVTDVSYGKQIHLKLISLTNSAVATAVLGGFWCDTQVAIGDIVNIVGDFDDNNCCHVSDDGNFIVVEPDTLLSGTSVVSSIHCMRRAVLSEKFKGSESKNHFMLYGSVIHFVFQQILLKKSNRLEAVKQTIDETMQQIQFIREMYSLGLSEAIVRAEIDKYQSPMCTFITKHCVSDRAAAVSTMNDRTEDIFVTNVADIEENIWSPRFGIKGRIDMTVEVKMRDKNRKFSATKTIPLELKTGKSTFSVEHKGQVTLYSLMCSERREEVENGILLYLKDLAMQVVPTNYANKRGLIQLRNEMVYSVKRTLEHSVDNSPESPDCSSLWPFGKLPEPINSERTCSGCPQLLSCALYQHVEQWKPTNQSHVMLLLASKTLSHLADVHLSFFRHWCHLLHLEALAERSQGNDGPSGIWMQTGHEREKAGNCISCLQLNVGECRRLDVEKYMQVFRRHRLYHSANATSLADVGLQVTDSVVISAENKPLIAVATGCIVQICAETVSVVTDRDLALYLDDKDTVCRLDRCNTFNSMATHITSLARLMNNTLNSEKLRRLIIERSTPQFERTMSRIVVDKVKDLMKPLNKPQKAAILKVLMCKDYMLIKGYPGTGKTSTIVALIRILVRIGCSVLLASYTHSAVDNILLKLQQHGDVEFVRLGRLERIHPSIQKFADETLTRNIKSVDQLTNFYATKTVVATTCLGVNHVLFARRTFDVCIVDEASQVSMPACLGPLFHCQRFVLVGDPKQLAPVIRSRDARALGMDESLFVRLENNGATCDLSLQYRMNSSIMRLSNELVYSGALVCASDAVSQARLSVSASKTMENSSSDWLSRCSSGSQGDEVLWLDIDPLLNDGSAVLADVTKLTSPVQSRLEALIVQHVVQQLINVGVGIDDIGVITPYQQQVRLLRDTLKTIPGLSNVEVNTVDQYQGRDKSVIIISFVRTHRTTEQTSSNEILADERRLNVALTRARHKLIFVGSIKSLLIYPPLRTLINNILSEDLILPVHRLHPSVCQ